MYCLAPASKSRPEGATNWRMASAAELSTNHIQERMSVLIRGRPIGDFLAFNLYQEQSSVQVQHPRAWPRAAPQQEKDLLLEKFGFHLHAQPGQRAGKSCMSNSPGKLKEKMQL